VMLIESSALLVLVRGISSEMHMASIGPLAGGFLAI
jgi:hypothetical protein